MHSHRSLLNSLLALALMGAVLERQRTELTSRSPSSDTSPTTPTSATGDAAQQAQQLGVGALLGEILGVKPPAAAPDAQGQQANGCGGCQDKTVAMAVEIPTHIAEAAGMNAPGFDPNSPSGRIIALLTAAQAQVLALGDSNPAALEVARYKHTNVCIGAAIGMLGQQAL
jgi:hypothetical protein